MGDALRLRCTSSSLRALSVKENINTAYQTGHKEEFADASAATRANDQWLVLTASHRQPALRGANDAKVLPGYFKTMLELGSYFSLPRSVYERCVDPASSGALAACGLRNILRSSLNVVDADAPAFYFDVDACVV